MILLSIKKSPADRQIMINLIWTRVRPVSSARSISGLRVITWSRGVFFFPRPKMSTHQRTIRRMLKRCQGSLPLISTIEQCILMTTLRFSSDNYGPFNPKRNLTESLKTHPSRSQTPKDGCKQADIVEMNRWWWWFCCWLAVLGILGSGVERWT